MITKHNDIDDDEIRIISSENAQSLLPPKRKPRSAKSRKLLAWLCGLVALLAIGGLAIIVFSTGDMVEEDELMPESIAEPPKTVPLISDSTTVATPYVERIDTLVDGISLSIFIPWNANPVLEIGNDVTNDTTAVLIAQAADVRRDNGNIVGSFVKNGELLSKGEAKAGFCAIINGKVTIGVADATPMLEQALMSNGYFFRQYPLVVGGQIVENKPRGKAKRKALAEIDGRIAVIISNNRVTFHDFSQALIDAGVSNAIYLVGGNSHGCFKNASGITVAFGPLWDNDIKNVNYIVWR